MKRLFLFSLTVLAVLFHQPLSAQAVLNEIYSDPGAGNHEFFELYNTSISGAPISMDNYSIVTYFESGTEKGFYVLDLPNLAVGPKGYFVGASQKPFNYQGTQNSTMSNFSWNDPQLSDMFGYIKKFTLTGNANTPDNQKLYTESSIPANFNDLFYKRNGNGASYSTFIYQNGLLVNVFFGGTGGVTSAPAHITNMPPLPVNIVTKDTTRSFIIDFTTFNSSTIEGVTETTGSDNGFIRNRDGLCKFWGKSSANVYHTPGSTNGGAAGIQGSLTISNHIYIGSTPTDSSFLSYNITSGPVELFPVNLQVYLDNGVVEGQLDSADAFVDQHTETIITDGGFNTKYAPQYQDLLLVAETSIGCLDQVVHISPAEKSLYTVLPLKISQFTATQKIKHTEIKWTVDANASAKSFEVEKSYDGIVFTSVGTLLSTTHKGTENYFYKLEQLTPQKTYLRLKMTGRNNVITYSGTIALAPEKEINRTAITLMQNPIHHQLALQFIWEKEEEIGMNVYNMAGIRLKHSKVKTQKGTNYFSMAVEDIKAGTYIVQLSGLHHSNAIKFVKQ